MLDLITDQDNAIRRLKAMVHNRSVPHALLFSGIDGVGKSTAAKALAMYINCLLPHEKDKDSSESTYDNLKKDLEPACNCRSCRKIKSGTHPDILAVSPSNGIIKIATIRELCRKLLVKPVEASKRVVIINDAHTMNQESGNALLKVLEEPPSSTMFILTTDQAADIMPTILSRCQSVTFKPLPIEKIHSQLITLKKIDPDKADIISRLAEGSLGKALELSEDQKKNTNPITFRRYLFSEFEGLINGDIFDKLSFAEKMSKKKELALFALETFLSFIRDLVVLPFDRNRIVNCDMEDRLKKITGHFTTASLLDMADRITSAQQSIKANASVRLCLETMAVKMKRI